MPFLTHKKPDILKAKSYEMGEAGSRIASYREGYDAGSQDLQKYLMEDATARRKFTVALRDMFLTTPNPVITDLLKLYDKEPVLYRTVHSL